MTTFVINASKPTTIAMRAGRMFDSIGSQALGDAHAVKRTVGYFSKIVELAIFPK
jgi:hypothetical protein